MAQGKAIFLFSSEPLQDSLGSQTASGTFSPIVNGMLTHEPDDTSAICSIHYNRAMHTIRNGKSRSIKDDEKASEFQCEGRLKNFAAFRAGRQFLPVPLLRPLAVVTLLD